LVDLENDTYYLLFYSYAYLQFLSSFISHLSLISHLSSLIIMSVQACRPRRGRLMSTPP